MSHTHTHSTSHPISLLSHNTQNDKVKSALRCLESNGVCQCPKAQINKKNAKGKPKRTNKHKASKQAKNNKHKRKKQASSQAVRRQSIIHPSSSSSSSSSCSKTRPRHHQIRPFVARGSSFLITLWRRRLVILCPRFKKKKSRAHGAACPPRAVGASALPLTLKRTPGLRAQGHSRKAPVITQAKRATRVSALATAVMVVSGACDASAVCCWVQLGAGPVGSTPA